MLIIARFCDEVLPLGRFFFVDYSMSHSPGNNVPNASLLVSCINVSIIEST